MGALSDVLIVALGSGGAGVVLARSLSLWIQHRTADLKVTLKGPAGTVELEGRRIRDPEAVIEALREVTGQ
jgi:cytidylate kinase